MLELLLNSFTILLTATIVGNFKTSLLFVLTLHAVQFSFLIFTNTHKYQGKGIAIFRPNTAGYAGGEKFKEEKAEIV